MNIKLSPMKSSKKKLKKIQQKQNNWVLDCVNEEKSKLKPYSSMKDKYLKYFVVRVPKKKKIYSRPLQSSNITIVDSSNFKIFLSVEKEKILNSRMEVEANKQKKKDDQSDQDHGQQKQKSKMQSQKTKIKNSDKQISKKDKKFETKKNNQINSKNSERREGNKQNQSYQQQKSHKQNSLTHKTEKKNLKQPVQKEEIKTNNISKNENQQHKQTKHQQVKNCKPSSCPKKIKQEDQSDHYQFEEEFKEEQKEGNQQQLKINAKCQIKKCNENEAAEYEEEQIQI